MTFNIQHRTAVAVTGGTHCPTMPQDFARRLAGATVDGLFTISLPVWTIVLVRIPKMMGSAPASGAVFRAFAKTTGRIEMFQPLRSSHAHQLRREARPATPGAGGLPNFSAEHRTDDARIVIIGPEARHAHSAVALL